MVVRLDFASSLIRRAESLVHLVHLAVEKLLVFGHLLIGEDLRVIVVEAAFCFKPTIVLHVVRITHLLQIGLRVVGLDLEFLQLVELGAPVELDIHCYFLVFILWKRAWTIGSSSGGVIWIF